MVSEEELQAIRDAARWLPKRGGSHDIKLLLEHIDGLESEIALCSERIYLQDGELLSRRMEADRYAAEAEAAYRQRDQAQSASDPDVAAIRSRLVSANNLALDESVARWYRTDVPALLAALEAAQERLAKVEALADEWTEEGDSLIRNCHSGRDVNEGEQMRGCASALRTALATTSEEAER